MTKKEFNRLLKETKRHWEEDIIGATPKFLREQSPITMESCAVCSYFEDNCSECFLEGGIHGCMNEVCEANMSIENYIKDYQYNCPFLLARLKKARWRYNIKPVRRACKRAYKAILKRFEEYRKEHFGD